MRRSIGRIGGAVAGIIAIVFGVLDLIDKLPPWVLIALGAIAILGVLADYFWERRDQGSEQSSAKVHQKQQSGRKSTNHQAGRDINIHQLPLQRGEHQ